MPNDIHVVRPTGGLGIIAVGLAAMDRGSAPPYAPGCRCRVVSNDIHVVRPTGAPGHHRGGQAGAAKAVPVTRLLPFQINRSRAGVYASPNQVVFTLSSMAVER